MITTIALAIFIAKVVLTSGIDLPNPAANPPAPAVPAPDPALPRGPFAQGDDPKRATVAATALRPLLTAELTAAGLKFGAPVFIRVFKEERLLELWIRQPDKSTYQLFRSYPVAGMSGRLGPKLAEGDNQAPEGFYFVPKSMMHPTSTYHLAFNLGYPNTYDRSHHRTGSFLMVHGNRVSIGCYAMTDAMIEEIFTLCDAALGNGQPYFRIHCFPFRMTPERMDAAKLDEWFPFWQNLREGHDLFEQNKIPPDVSVRNQRYHFE